MIEKKEIVSIEDIKTLVNEFYGKVRKDELLKGVFNDRIRGHWPEHLEKMYRFWQTVLIGEHTYYGSPFIPHAQLPVKIEHFNRWLELFCETVDTHFIGLNAEKAKMQGQKMAEMFYYKIQYYKSTTAKPIL